MRGRLDRAQAPSKLATLRALGQGVITLNKNYSNIKARHIDYAITRSPLISEDKGLVAVGAENLNAMLFEMTSSRGERRSLVAALQQYKAVRAIMTRALIVDGDIPIQVREPSRRSIAGKAFKRLSEVMKDDRQYEILPQ